MKRPIDMKKRDKYATFRLIYHVFDPAPPGARTPDTLIKSQVLYQLS
jgi:hypothetical protein